MDLNSIFDEVINEVAAVKRVTKENGQYKIVIKDGNKVEEFLFRHHKYNALRNELKKYYGDKLVEKIITLVKKNETNGQFRDEKVDFEVDGDKVKFIPMNEDAPYAELIGKVKNGKIVSEKWSGTLSKDVTLNLKNFINRRFGLDKIAGNDAKADVKLDTRTKEFIINFETPATDMGTGKKLTSTRVSQARILSGR